MSGNLHLYDWTDNVGRRSGYAEEYCSDFSPITGQCSVNIPGNEHCAISSIQDAANTIEVFGRRMMTIDRIWFHTHGAPGYIHLPNGGIRASNVSTLAAACATFLGSPGYIYFLGCNVAEGSKGEAFMRAAGSSLLAHGGGSVFGSDSVTFSVPFLGQRRPIWSDIIEAVVAPGGGVTIRTH